MPRARILEGRAGQKFLPRPLGYLGAGKAAMGEPRASTAISEPVSLEDGGFDAENRLQANRGRLRIELQDNTAKKTKARRSQ